MEKIDFSKELQEFYEKNKNNKLVFSYMNKEKPHPNALTRDVVKKNGGWDNVLMILGNNIIITKKDVIIIGSGEEKGGHKLRNIGFLLYIFNFKIEDIDKLSGKPVTGGNIFYRKESDIGYFSYENKKICLISSGDNQVLTLIDQLKIQIKNFILKNKLELKIDQENKLKEQKLKEKQRLKELKVSQTNLLSELDKDGNGEVDVTEGNDFNLLLKKHQKSITEIDRNYIQQFVKISSYLKTKKNNIQLIFNSIKDTPNEETLNQYVEILKDDIHSYNLVLFNSLNMIVSLVEDDNITFYELHEMFDNLNIFDSKHERDVSQKLSNIGDGLKDLMNSIKEMGRNIENQMGELTYVTEQTNRVLDNQLQSIDSSIKTNNLLTGINAYQTYKLRKGK
jgi:hypothetical protein